MRPELLDHFHLSFHPPLPHSPSESPYPVFAVGLLFDSQNASTRLSPCQQRIFAPEEVSAGRNAASGESCIAKKLILYPNEEVFMIFRRGSATEIRRASAYFRERRRAWRWSSPRNAAFRRRASPCTGAA